MTQQSSAELDSTQSAEGEVPLLDRPLMADDQNTVVSSGTELADNTPSETAYSATAQEIRDRLFSTQTDEQNREHGLRIGHFDVEERIGSGGMDGHDELGTDLRAWGGAVMGIIARILKKSLKSSDKLRSYRRDLVKVQI